MNNKITINIKETLNLPDNSITDMKTIRQIGLVTTDFSFDISNEDRTRLGNKVKQELQFGALYPHVHNI